MRGRIFCPAGELTVDKTFDSEAILGRSRDNTVVLASGYLSAQHARIAWQADASCFFLEDLDSSNGTFLDGERVTEPQPMGHLHVITLAERYDFVFQDLGRCAARRGQGPVTDVQSTSGSISRTSIQVLDLPLPDLLKSSGTTPSERTLLQRLALPLPSFLRPDDGDTLAPTASPAPIPAPTTAPPAAADAAITDNAAATSRGFILEVVDDPELPRHTLGTGEHVIGRTAHADIRIQSPEVSRRHARLIFRDGRLTVRDLGSSNGTFIDDVRIDAEMELRSGQRLRLGAFETRILDESPTDDDGGERRSTS